jgi:DNA-binding LacI/PurR family transcriptional regulator
MASNAEQVPMRHVARAAGMSLATVPYVVNGSVGMSGRRA